MQRLRKSWFKNKNNDLSWKDWKSLDSRTRTMISYQNTGLQKSWFKKRTMVSHKKTAKVLLKNNNDDISRNDCKSLYTRTRTITMIYLEMTAKVLIQEQERWYLIKIQYCSRLDSRKERWYLIKKKKQKSCSRTRTMISHLNIPTGCPTKGILNPPKRMPKYQGTHKNLNHSKRLYKKDHSGCLFILNANEVLYWQNPCCPGL